MEVGEHRREIAASSKVIFMLLKKPPKMDDNTSSRTTARSQISNVSKSTLNVTLGFAEIEGIDLKSSQSTNSSLLNVRPEENLPTSIQEACKMFIANLMGRTEAEEHEKAEKAEKTVMSEKSTHRESQREDEKDERSLFVEMIKGSKKKTYSRLPRPAYNNDDPLKDNQIQDAADLALTKRGYPDMDPVHVAAVIDELNMRKIEALEKNDYKAARRMQDAIDNLRRNFRMKDREELHKMVIQKCDARNNESLEKIEKAKAKWKNIHVELQKHQRERYCDFQDRINQQLNDLKSLLESDKTTRKFDKRSPELLQNRQKEQYMLLCGMFEQAEQMKKVNTKNEKEEMMLKQVERETHFEYAYQQLVKRAQEENQILILTQQFELQLLNEKEKNEMEKLNRRLAATTMNLNEEKNFDYFVAKRFRKSSSDIMPATCYVSHETGVDLPALSLGHTTPPGFDRMKEIRSKSVVTPLPLPPLKAKKFKVPKYTKDKKKNTSSS